VDQRSALAGRDGPMTPAADGAPAATATATSPPLRRDAAGNRARLLAAAAKVFADGGLKAGVDDVARVAGLGMGTLYRHFPTKDALIDELVRELLVDLLQAARDRRAELGGTGLEHFLGDVGAQQSARLGCLPRLWSTPRHVEIMNEIRTETAGLLADAQAHGRVRADLVPTDVYAVMWSLRGVIVTTHAAEPEAWRRHLEIVVLGLRPSDVPLTHAPVPEADRLIDSLTV
jgi:AcrR family transcriptional regulator